MDRLEHSCLLVGTWTAPASKSYSQRALAASMLLEETTIFNLGGSSDELSMLQMIADIGLDITHSNNSIVIKKKKWNESIVLQANESGLAARMMSLLMLSHEGSVLIEANGSLVSRSMSHIYSLYDQLGIQYRNQTGFPIQFHGPARYQDVIVDGTLSSQYITGLLFLFAHSIQKESLIISINNPTSIPYIQLTIDILRSIGADISIQNNYQEIIVKPTTLHPSHTFKIEGDWSSASLFIVAAAISGNVFFDSLNLSSSQGDRCILDLVQQCGAIVNFGSDGFQIKSNSLRAFNFDSDATPDLIPAICLLALFCEGISQISGVDRLRYKESDRLEGILTEFSKFSNGISYQNNTITVHGNAWIHSQDAALNGMQDHRMVMSLAMLNVLRGTNHPISHKDAVHKSYPNFYDDLNLLLPNKSE